MATWDQVAEMRVAWINSCEAFVGDLLWLWLGSLRAQPRGCVLAVASPCCHTQALYLEFIYSYIMTVSVVCQIHALFGASWIWTGGM